MLVRDRELHRDTFTLTPEYLKHGDRGTAGGPIWFSDYGIQLTRGFKALKVWMAMKTYGVDKIGRVIAQNVRQAEYLSELVEKSPALELVAPTALNVVCFRYTNDILDEAHLNALNAELLIRVQEFGRAVPSGTTVKGLYARDAARLQITGAGWKTLTYLFQMFCVSAENWLKRTKSLFELGYTMVNKLVVLIKSFNKPAPGRRQIGLFLAKYGETRWHPKASS